MPRMKALQNIYYHRSTYQKGDDFMALDTEVKGLVDQGFAEVIADSEVAQKIPEDVNTAEAPTVDKPLNKMNRTELESYASSIGMTELEQYGTKADLLKAIESSGQ